MLTNSQRNQYPKLKPFTFHGVDFDANINGQATAACPFCGKAAGHFYVDTETGQYKCHHCQEKGNHSTFLRWRYDQCRSSTTDADLRSLSKLRHGIPAKAFKDAGMARDGDHWLMPGPSRDGGFGNLYVWDGEKVWSSPCCEQQLLLPENLAKTGPVYVTEGHWDTYALADVLTRLKLPGCVVGVPGATTFKDGWVPAFKGREVVLLYDNDKAGRDGMATVTRKLQPVAASVTCIKWPSRCPEGFDVSDLICQHLRSPKAAWGRLQGFLGKKTKSKTKPAAPADTDDGLTCLADVKAKPVDWLWEDRVPLGKLTILSGNPGVGKGHLAVDVAARLTRGDRFPGTQKKTRKGSVILIGTEDALADTIKPRLQAAGADCNKVHDLKIDGSKSHLDRLEKAIRKVKARLVIIDPISAYLEGVNTHRNAESRQALRPLMEMAERSNIAILAIDHLTKAADTPAAYRSQGSIAFTAAPRASWFLVEDPHDPERRLLLPNKVSNARKTDIGLAFRIVSKTLPKIGKIGMVKWEEGVVSMRTDEALCPATPRQTSRMEAEKWLLEKLKRGKVWVKELEEMAEKEGMTWWAVYKASQRLGVVKSEPGGKGSKSYWSLPKTETTP